MDRAERREGAGRVRRCALSHETLPEDQLVRFVADPEGRIFPDPAARAPGRGVWVRARGADVDQAVRKNVFAKSLKRPVKPDADLRERTAAALRSRCLDLLGLGRRGGALVCGFDQVAASLRKAAPAARIEASDGAADGRRKLDGLTRGWEDTEDGDAPVLRVGCYTGAELGMAFGRDHVIHAVLLPGRFAESWTVEIGRLAGFLPLVPEDWEHADP